eukprot:TRINITY_DN4184_c0_g1_i1.p1 TRINITY_DN4184_c0_g1~~TRINITY_DN4184_c0_g1_i1.p1  ORF type:complete len:527 (+),score=193.36 TRINITY_DN4184_c0_g1_i1:77-1582(+)
MAAAAYRAACQRNRVKKPNAVLLRELEPEQLATLETVGFGGTYVGNRGLMALLDVIEQAPRFKSLDLSAQKIYNSDLSPDTVKGNALLDRLCEVARAHHGLREIDLGGNPLSNFAARKLLALVTDNPRICKLGLDDTRIDADLLCLIAKRVAANARASGPEDEEEPFANAPPPDEAQGEDGGFGCITVSLSPKNLTAGKSAGASRRRTVMTASYDQEEAKRFKAPKYPKEEAQTRRVMALLRDNLLFSHLDSDVLQTVVEAMQCKVFSRGDEPLREGDEGNTLYVIASGQCDILKQGVKVAEKQESSAFGELELMYDTPCCATVQVVSDEAVTWALDRDTYKHLVVGASIRKRQQYEALLASIPFLVDLAPYEQAQLADALSSDEWKPGTTIIKHGAEGQWMFIIVEGTVEVVGRDPSGNPVKVCEMNAGEHFGELEFFNNHPCVADVRSITTVKTAKINRRHFEMCLGPVMHILKRNQAAPKYEYYRDIVEKRQQAEAAK